MSLSPEQSIKTAAQLYAFRDLARSFLGAAYQARMADYGEVIKRAAAAWKVSDLQAAVRIANDSELSELTRSYVLAAIVELVEPAKVAA